MSTIDRRRAVEIDWADGIDGRIGPHRTGR